MQIGFSQRVQLSWLEYTAGLVSNGKDRGEINAALQDLLEDKLSVGHNVQRGNREKAITILLKIWQCPPEDLIALRDEGLGLLARLPSAQHVAIHWGMCMAVYPFFGAVAATVGRLLRLQHDVSTAQVQRRIREQLGERETVARAARRIYRSFIDWGLLAETGKKGTYRKAKLLETADLDVVGWLTEAVLRANGDGWTPVASLTSHPACFPFSLPPVSAAQLGKHPALKTMRHGVNEELVRVAEGRPVEL
jgi:hypothetical protein